MTKIAVVTDSIACLPADLVEKHHIHIAPAVTILFEGKIYRDWVDISYEEAFRILDKNPEHFSTSPSPAGFLEVFRQLSQQGQPIVCITVSSGFSTLHDMAREAREIVTGEIPGAEIEIIDSRTATAAQGFVVLAAARAAEEGKNLKQVVATAIEVRDKVDLFFVFETIRHIYRTGRVPKLAAQIGSMLNVKPIITIRNGLAHFSGVARTKDKGLNRIVALTREKVGSKPVHMAVVHANVLEEAEKLKERVQKEFNCVELWITSFSPIMAYGTGRGVVGLAFYTEGASNVD